MFYAVSQERILEDSMRAALREQYILLPDQHFPWRWQQYMLLIDQYIFSRIRAMYIYRANNTSYLSKAILIVVQNIATMCTSMRIAPINMIEDLCEIHIGFPICCPIVGAMHIDSDIMIVFNTFNTYFHVGCFALNYTYWATIFNLLSCSAVTPIVKDRVCVEYRWRRVSTSPNASAALY